MILEKENNLDPPNLLRVTFQTFSHLLIMVIELCGVQFGLKSYAWFQNRVRFEITSMISDQNCTTRSSITTLLHPF